MIVEINKGSCSQLTAKSEQLKRTAFLSLAWFFNQVDKKKMDKQYDPARSNQSPPAPGIAAVNTHTPQEETIEKAMEEQQKEGKQGNSEPLDEKKDER